MKKLKTGKIKKSHEEDPIVRDFSISTLERVLEVADEIEACTGRVAYWSRKEATTERKRLKVNIRFGDHRRQIDEIRDDVNSCLLLLDSEEDLKKNEFDVLISIIFCALDEIGVDFKEYLYSSKAKLSKNKKLYNETRSAIEDIYKIYDDLVRINDAFFGNKKRALDVIYKTQVGTKLDQYIGPYTFSVKSGVIETGTNEPKEKKGVHPDAFSALKDQAQEFLKITSATNIDPRLLSIIRKYIHTLSNKDFSSVRLEFHANEIRALLTAMRHELSGPAIVAGTALSLSHEQVMRHFKRWREFVEQAPLPMSDSLAINDNALAIIKLIASPGHAISLAISPRVSQAAADLEEASSIQDHKGAIQQVILRSVANFAKANIKYVISFTRRGSLELNGLVHRVYFSLFIRLLPHFKLLCSYVAELAWLVPILDYIGDLNQERQNTSKARKTKKSD